MKGFLGKKDVKAFLPSKEAAEKMKAQMSSALPSKEAKERMKAQMSSALEKSKKASLEALDKTKEVSKVAYDKTKEQAIKANDEIQRRVQEQRALMEKEELEKKKKNTRNQQPVCVVVDKKSGKPQAGKPQPIAETWRLNCFICENKIPINPATGNIEFLNHVFFEDEKFCPSHLAEGSDKVRRCTSCSRYEPQNHPFVTLNDGEGCERVICKPCRRTVPTSVKNDIMPSWEKVVTFFESQLHLPCNDDMRKLKIKVVKQDLLKEESIKVGVPIPTDEGMTRGLCLSEIDQNTATSENELKPKVSCILCLRGLPRDLTASVLAHEATHAWIKLHPEYDLMRQPIPPLVEEGVCQLISYLFLKDGLGPITETKNSSAAGPSDEQLRQYFQYAIENDEDQIYGDGFRLAHSVYEATGRDLPKLLDHVVKHRNLPST